MRQTILLVVLSGCVSTVNYRAESVRAPIGVTDDDLYAASVRVLMDRGHDVRTKDREAGIVATEWVVVAQAMSVVLYHSWRVVITEGEFRLMIDCENQSSSQGRVTCSTASRNEEFASLAPVIRDEIIAEAQRRAVSRHESPPTPTPSP